jgi:hypothetical protein
MLCCQACNSGFDYISSTIRFDNCIVAVNYVTLPKGYVAGFPLPVQTDMMVIQRTAPQLACQAYSRPPSAELSATFGPSVQANRVSKPPTKPKVTLERCHPNEGLSTERLIPSAKRGRSNKQLLVKDARVPLPTTPIRFLGLGPPSLAVSKTDNALVNLRSRALDLHARLLELRDAVIMLRDGVGPARNAPWLVYL